MGVLETALGAPLSSAESLMAWSALAAVVVATLGFGATGIAVGLAARQLTLEALPVIVISHSVELRAPADTNILYLTIGKAFNKPNGASFNESFERPTDAEAQRVLCKIENAGRTAAIDLRLYYAIPARSFKCYSSLGVLLPGESTYVSINTDALQELETIFVFTHAECVSIFGSHKVLNLFGNVCVSLFNQRLMAAGSR